MSQRDVNVVVCGATGYLGRAVVQATCRAGHWVRALARDPAGLGLARHACSEVFVGEATRPSTLEGLFEGVDVAVSSIGTRSFRRHPTIWEVDRDANLALVEAAEAAGVRRFVFVSVFRGPELRSRLAVAEAREQVADRLRTSAMTSVIVRPTGFFNDMKEIFDMAARGRVWLVGSGATVLNPIHAEDLAERIVETFSAKAPVEIDVGGPDRLTQLDIGRLAFSTLGRKARFGHVPPALMRFAAGALRPLNANASAFLELFASLGEHDAVAPSFGRRKLADEMQSWARASGS
jgi:uncharacterized protein YbjT (DUF2867 family)